MTLYILVIGDEVRERHRHVFEALGQVLWGCNLSKIRISPPQAVFNTGL